MSIENIVNFSNTVKIAEFFPYEWSHNLLAVCLHDCVKVYSFIPKQESDQESELQLLLSVSFEGRIDHFSWSPKTNVATLNPIVEFAICDNSGKLIQCYNELNKDGAFDASSLKRKDFKIEADLVYKISYDHQNGDLIAFTADNFCSVWDCNESKYYTRFMLQSSGVDVAFHRDEKNKLMVAERLGLIRIYNLETRKPIYTLLSINNVDREIKNSSILSIDWCQSSPELVIATTSSDIIFWNTNQSSLPSKTIDNQSNLKTTKLAKYKDDIIGYLCGTDRSSKINILNYKSNQITYQSNDTKLLSSFSFNSVMPVVAIANEQKLTIVNLLNQ